MLTVYRSATFQLSGGLQFDGVPYDFTGWGLLANVYNTNGTVLIANLTVNWIDQTKGLLTLSYPDTSAWPVGKARIDVQATAANGEIILSPPEYFRIGESPITG